MPYFITDNAPSCPIWAVVKRDGSVIACHDTKEGAVSQMVALSIAEGIEPAGELPKTLKLSADEKRIVWAEVYAPNRLDSDGDYMTADTIEEMAYQFMADENLKQIDVNHDNKLVPGAIVVESFIARAGDPDFIPGSWVVGVHVPDDKIWGMIKSGELNGFSMEALVKRVPNQPVKVKAEQVVTGETGAAANHTHTFTAYYDEEANRVYGRTSVDMGHYHEILRGTATEEANGHVHTFSFVDDMEVTAKREYLGRQINTVPNADMAAVAKRALQWRKEFNRGGTAVGVARARDIANRANLSFSTVRRMNSYFARHEVDKKAEGFRQGEKGFPSAGRVAWDLWGGNAGQSWAAAIAKKMDQAEQAASRKAVNAAVGDFVSWEYAGERVIGRVVRMRTQGQMKHPTANVVRNATPENPAYLIRAYRDGQQTDALVVRLSTELEMADSLE